MTARRMTETLVAFILTASFASVRADDWPQFRGQNRDGVSAEKGLLQKWPEGGPTKLWTTNKLGGTNGSSVAIAEGTIYGVGSDRGKPTLWALEEKSGKLKWATPISNNSAAGGHSTPTFAKGKVYAMSEKGDLACVDATKGTVLWRKSFVDDFDGRISGFGGYSESVLVDDGVVICTPGSKDAAIVALKADTGEVIWKTAIEGKPHWVYCSPMKAKVGEVPMYITLLAGSQGGVTAVHAKTGKVLWQYKSVYEGPYPIPNPVIKDDKVVVSTFGGWAVLQMSADSSQDVTVKELKRHKRDDLSCYWGGMTPVGEYIYFAHTQRPPEGYLPFLPVCVSWKGDIQWKAKEAPGGKGKESSSAGCISADGMLYFLYEDGTVALVKADPTEYKLISKFIIPVSEKKLRGHPAIANGRLYIRDKGDLHCYDIKAEMKE